MKIKRGIFQSNLSIYCAEENVAVAIELEGNNLLTK